MINNKLKKINKLIEEKKIDEAQLEISKLNKDFYNEELINNIDSIRGILVF